MSAKPKPEFHTIRVQRLISKTAKSNGLIVTDEGEVNVTRGLRANPKSPHLEGLAARLTAERQNRTAEHIPG